jgi:hypothetical protein
MSLTEVCEAGAYAVAITDANGTVIEVTFDLVYGATPFSITENFAIDCLSGGEVLIGCTLYYFSPSDRLSNGEACVVPPDCWSDPASYIWVDDNGNFIGTTDCITDLFPGEFNVEITNDEGDVVFFTLVLDNDGALGFLTEEACEPNSIEETSALSFTLSPNPTADYVQLTVDLPNQNLHLWLLTHKAV